jgi:LmbE family N-acetylglucosaminyl deacetylase
MAPGARGLIEGDMPGGTIDEAIGRLIAERQTLLLVVAHPDDDVLGAGALLARAPWARIVYVTDGAPRDGRDARGYGFATPEEYAAARRREALAALALADVAPHQTVWMDVADQQATSGLERIAGLLRELIMATRADMLLTHPYEGGHPDHDAVAFAVRAAVTVLERSAGGDRRAPVPIVAEFAGYHAGPDGERQTSFLPHPGFPEVLFQLSAAERGLKSRMLALHATQATVLADFPRDRELFRLAPPHDFSRPPHPGPLLYERSGSGGDWGIDGVRWRARAAAASRRLGLP